MDHEYKEIPDLLSILDDLVHPNPNINNKAYILMREYYSIECIKVLLGNLKENNVYLRRKSILALGALGKKVFAPIASLYRSSENDTIRTSCLKVIIKVVVNEDLKEVPLVVLDLIDLALKDNSIEIILTSVSLLKQIGRQGIERLILASQDRNILKAKASISALSEIEDPLVLDFLNKLSKDDSLDPIIRDDLISYS